jgi:hypothetical protein
MTKFLGRPEGQRCHASNNSTTDPHILEVEFTDRFIRKPLNDFRRLLQEHYNIYGASLFLLSHFKGIYCLNLGFLLSSPLRNLKDYSFADGRIHREPSIKNKPLATKAAKGGCETSLSSSFLIRKIAEISYDLYCNIKSQFNGISHWEC